MKIPDNLLSDTKIYKKYIQSYFKKCFNHFPNPIPYKNLITEFLKAKPPKKNGNHYYNKRNSITRGIVKFTIKSDYSVSMNMKDKKVIEADARYRVIFKYFENTMKYCKKMSLPVPNTYCVVFFADRHPFELEFNKVHYPMFSFSCPLNKHYPLIPDNTFMEFSFKERFGKGESWDLSKKTFAKNIQKTFKDKRIFFRGKDTTKNRTNARRILYDIQDKKMMNIELLEENAMKYIPMYEFSKYKYLLDLPGQYEWSNRLPRLFLCNRLVIKLNYDIIQYPDEKEFMAFTDLIMRPNVDYLKYETRLNETKYVNYNSRSEKNKKILEDFQRKMLKDIKKMSKKDYDKICGSGYKRINQLKNKHLYLYLYYGILENHKYLLKMNKTNKMNKINGMNKLMKGGDLQLSRFNFLLNNSFSDKKVREMWDYYFKNRKLCERIFYKTDKIFPKTRIAIIIPYRDQPKQNRAAQLKRSISHFKKFLKDFDYRIFIIEQCDDGEKFNRGKLLNIGIQKAIVYKYDVIISHDADIYPNEDALPLYTCIPKYPNHIGNIWKTKYKYWEFIGGILAMTPEQSKTVNGYPNYFWGWGGEDDALYNRIANTYEKILKPESGSVEEWEHNKSSPGSTNLHKMENIMVDLLKWKKNGLNSLKYYTMDVLDYGETKIKDPITDKNRADLEEIYKTDYKFIEKPNKKRRRSPHRVVDDRYYTLKSDKYKIIFFWNAKAGCSTLKRFIYETEENEKLKPGVNIHSLIGQGNKNKYYVKMTPENLKKYKDYKKILLFRDPVSRVFSYFKDKVLQQKRDSFIRKNKKDWLGPLTTFDELIENMKKINKKDYQHHLHSQTDSISREWVDDIVDLKDFSKFLKDLANYKTHQENKTEGKTNISKYTVDIKIKEYTKKYIKHNL